MPESIMGAKVASFIILSHYHKLKDLELAGEADSDAYRSIVGKLRKHVKVENDEYDKAKEADIDSFLARIDETGQIDEIDGRCYLKLKERKKELSGGFMIDRHTLLSSAISSKLYIDILKDVDEKINSLNENNELDEDDIEMLQVYHINYKYHYLSANKFLEQIAIDSNFVIPDLPDFTFKEIEVACGVTFMDSIQNILYDYITGAIDELANFEADDKYLLSYISIFEVARVKVMLPYLSEEKLDKIIELYKDNKYSYDKNGALRKVKKLIKKRKEEFSE